MSRRFELPALLAAAFLIRLVWAVLIPVDPVSDAAAYQIFAQNLYHHGVYGFNPDEPGAYWAVGTAALYAGAYIVFGEGGLAVIAVNMLSSLIVVWGLWDLGRRWFGEVEGRVAAGLFVLWPMAVQFVTIMASELHFMAASLLALMAWDRARGRATSAFWGFALLSGLALAAATYLRPIALLIPAALLIAALLRAPRSALEPFLKTLVTTGVIFLCVSPWSARNERVFGEPVFMSTNFWANFWMGNHPGSDGGYARLPDAVRDLGEIERSADLTELALGRLKDDPAGFVTRTIKKAVRLHERETIGVGWNEAAVRSLAGEAGVTGLKLLSTAWWYLMVLAALVGAMVLARRRGWWAALLSEPVWLWLYFTAVHAVIVVGDRYHMPAIPMIALLAALPLSLILKRSQPERRSQRQPG